MTIPDSARPHRPQRATLGAAAVWLGALGLAAFVALVLHSVQDSNRRLADGQQAQATVISRLSAGLDTTRQQLQQHGVTPSAPPAQSIVRGVPGVPGAPGIPGAAGAQGVPGVAGSPGVPGAAGRSGSPGSPGPVSTVPGPAGSPGAAGVQGVPGAPGTNGKDGAPGKDGTNGADGADGRDGVNGQPPAGWTYTWTDSAGVTHQVTCTRTDGSPDSAPMYGCADSTAPAPTPSPSAGAAARSGAVGVGMLAASAMYRRLP